MATSLVSTGVQFPDSTIQTTAAGAGGSSLEAVASGSLSNGSTVVVNSDGTVSVVAAIAQTVGTPVVFESASTNNISATFNATAGKVVISYRDIGNSQYGTAVVGTVSGTIISFGTPTVFRSTTTGEVSSAYNSTAGKVVIAYQDGSTLQGRASVGTVSGTSISFGSSASMTTSFTYKTSTAYDPINNKVVVSYRDLTNSNYGTVKVGTVSGTSISFGSEVVYETNNTYEAAITYDSLNQKVVIAYRDNTSSRGEAVVGEVSGTSVTFGSPVVFKNAATYNQAITYDSTNGKVVIAFSDEGNSYYGTAVVGTVSGTSISFGTPVVFEASSTVGTIIGASYNATAQKVVIAYADNNNSDYGTAIVGTVSGTSISFGSPVVIESAATNNFATTYDSANNKIVIAYRDDGNSNYGTSVVFQNAGTNLTDENFIGISNASYTNGQTATIQLVGSVDDAQTGLTAGQKYYVQTDGTLGLSPADPSVLAGTAQSATKLIIKR